MAAMQNSDVGGVNDSYLVLQSITYSATDLAAKLERFVAHGSHRHTLAPSDLHVVKDGTVRTPDPLTFEFLIKQGNRFFDALFYMGIDPAHRIPIQSVPTASLMPELTAQQISSALFFQYFMLLTRGSTSESGSATVGADVPKFLHTVLALNEKPEVYARRLATFNLEKIDPGWVKAMPFANISREAISRFGLGVAGYRIMAPFRLLRPKATLDPALNSAFAFAVSLATSDASWAVHPATRDPNILTRYGPINANMGNLALEAFEMAEIDELVAQRQLYARPKHDPIATQYKTWTGVFRVSPADRIFGAP